MKDPGGITPDWRSRDALLILLLVAVVAMTRPWVAFPFVSAGA
jgi:hypothetical protein